MLNIDDYYCNNNNGYQKPNVAVSEFFVIEFHVRKTKFNDNHGKSHHG